MTTFSAHPPHSCANGRSVRGFFALSDPSVSLAITKVQYNCSVEQVLRLAPFRTPLLPLLVDMKVAPRLCVSLASQATVPEAHISITVDYMHTK